MSGDTAATNSHAHLSSASYDASSAIHSLPVDLDQPSRVILWRALGPDDFASVREIVLAYHLESRYAHIAFSERKITKIFGKAVSRSDKNLVLCARYKGRTVGAIHAVVGEYYLGDGGRLATILGIYVCKDLRAAMLGGRVAIGLLRAAIDWASGQGAEEMTVHATSGLGARSVDSTLLRSGFSLLGGAYVARLKLKV